MFVVDTNILLYAADEDAPEHRPCREFLLACRRGPDPWYVTWGIIYEFLRVATHPRVFPHAWSMKEAWMFLNALWASPACSFLQETERHAQTAQSVLTDLPNLSGNMVCDAHIAILMKEHGVKRIYTRDTDFHRFPFLEVVDPLQAGRR